MPRICEFYGIVISLYWADHRASVDIASLEVIAGALPGRAMRLVREWGELHRSELAATWERAVAHEPLGTIEPLP
ncbi:MAG: DUF4160 domain-containing protein [Actinomycetota bacterium]|nr:DUF4160 domain-containing protein [Actinomycetota bacterium]